MLDKEFYISKLIATHLQDSADPAQQEELEAWINESAENRSFFSSFSDEQQMKDEILQYQQGNSSDLWIKTLSSIRLKKSKEKQLAIRRNYLFKYKVAALILVTLSAGLYFWNRKNNKIAIKDYNTAGNGPYIAPGKNEATLTLANGHKIQLSGTLDGEIAKEAGVVISKTAAGQIIYHVTVANEVQADKTNTLSTTKAETYRVRLPDGTAVILNSASSLKYPLSFSTLKERRVELTGEAYFEVAKDHLHPFIVMVFSQEVKVLGTHFNINAYRNENEVKTSLIEGSVEVHCLDQIKMLKPGEQAILSQYSSDITIKEFNPDDVIAWKDGLFTFNEANISEVMRQLERWYNVSVKYEGTVPDVKYTGKLKRDTDLGSILKALERTGPTRFQIHNNVIIVKK